MLRFLASSAALVLAACQTAPSVGSASASVAGAAANPAAANPAAASPAAASPVATNPVATNPVGIAAPEDRQGQRVAVNGTEIFVESSGTGEPLVLLHGYPLSGALFSRVRDELDDQYRVITLDHRGYGLSGSANGVRSVDTYAEDALAVLDRLGIESAHMGGMSMGGPILFSIMRQRPGAVRSAILIDTNHQSAGAPERGIWQGARRALEESGDVGSITPFLLPNMLSGQTRLVDAPGQADYLGRVVAQASLEGAIGGTYALENRPDATELIRNTQMPVLVVVGREDTLYPVSVSQDMARLAPRGELAVIPGAAHAAVFEFPEAVAAEIEAFLQRL